MIHSHLKIAATAGITLMFLSGCASLNMFGKADERWADYKSWTNVTAGTEPTGDPTGLLAVVHKGPEGYRNVYVNDIAKETLLGDAPYVYPVGSVVVKEQFDNKADWEAGENAGVTISVKASGGETVSKDDWIWADSYKGSAGASQFCSGCHTVALADDFVFTNKAFLDKHLNK